MTSREIPDVAGGGTVQAAWGNDVAQRTVQRYASQAAFPSAAGEGELAYSFADDAIFYNNGTGWVQVATGDFVPDAVYAQDANTGDVNVSSLTYTTVLAASPNRAWDTGRAVHLVAQCTAVFIPGSYGTIDFAIRRTSPVADLVEGTLQINEPATGQRFEVSKTLTVIDTAYDPSAGYQLRTKIAQALGGAGYITIGDRSLTGSQV